MVEFTSSIRNWGTKECNFLTKPKMTNAMWGAGLSFHRCHAELNVPVDPYLDNVFDGEEGSRGIRFFTHGYDVYTPNRVLVTHDYHGHQSNPVVHTWGGKNKAVHESHWKWMEEAEENRSKLSTFSSPRVNMMLGIGTPPLNKDAEIAVIRKSRYGLGNKRTLSQAVEFTGISLAKKKMVVNKCGNLNWVPYEESPNYGVGETLSRGNAGEDIRLFVVTPDAASFSVNSGPVIASKVSGVITESTPADNKLVGWLILLAIVAVVVILRLSTKKRKKDEMYKK